MHLLDFGARTDKGAIRTLNEDSILAVPPVFVVADGVGGSEGGELASALVVEEFGELARRPVIDAEGVRQAIEKANTRVRALHGDELHGASSTAVGAVGVMSQDEPYWVVFNIGDSRIYRLPAAVAGEDELPRELVQISVDHSHVQQLVDAGVITADEAETHPERNLVTRAIGAEEAAEADFWMIPMVPGDRWLICSDGLLADLSFEAVQERVRRPTPADETAEDLIAMALRAAVSDNVSAIVVDVVGSPEQSDAAEPTAVQPHRGV